MSGINPPTRSAPVSLDAADKPCARPEWVRAPERSNRAALRLITWIALACGRRFTRWLLHPISLYFVLFSPSARRHSTYYLQRALGVRPRFINNYRHIQTFTATILDRVYLMRERLDSFDLHVQGAALIHETLRQGRGAFLVGGHVGSFEVLRAVGQLHGGLRVAMVMYPDNARLINDALHAIAPQSKPKIIALGRMDSMLAVRDWLDSGGLAGILGDRQLGAESGRSLHLRIPFLGKEASFSDGPFRLAALLRRPMLFMAGIYLGGNRYEARFETLADFSMPMNAIEREAQIKQALRTYVARLEHLCREHPYNWFNFHDFWNEQAH